MRLILSLIMVLFVSVVFSQIVDDSTKQVYGPKTISYTRLNDALNNTGKTYSIDTSIYLFERRSFVDRSGRRFQDLGSYGTATFPIFYDPQLFLGRTSGFNAYTPFEISPEEIKYYDTKSPYIELLVSLGGGNRNLVNVGFSRNINPNWNLGFDVKKITTTKQLAPVSRIDRQVVATAVDAYTRYEHPEVPYQVLLSFSSMKHQAVELGGTRPTDTDSLRIDYFLFDNALTLLNDAQATVRTSQWNLYHDYQLTDQFQIYHELNYERESNVYSDHVGGPTIGGYDTYRDFYSDFLIDADSTNERSQLTSLTNEAGLKGSVSSLFYRFYARTRSLDWEYLLLDPTPRVTENSVGGYVRLRWKDKFAVSGNGEYLIGGEYRLSGSISSDYLDVTYTTAKTRVPFIYQTYFGNHHEWQNSFQSVFTNQLEGKAHFQYKFIKLEPFIRFTTHNNFLYFDDEIDPRQTDSPILMTNLGGKANLEFLNEKGEGWHLENEVIATAVSGDDADKMRVPDIFYNGRLFWRGDWFGDQIPVEFGVDMHARTAYFANAYAPEIQQFYLQNDLEIFGYLVADVFVNMKIDKFLLSLKMTHLNQPQNDGYFTTPYYPGQRQVIDLAIKWMFFD